MLLNLLFFPTMFHNSINLLQTFIKQNNKLNVIWNLLKNALKPLGNSLLMVLKKFLLLLKNVKNLIKKPPFLKQKFQKLIFL